MIPDQSIRQQALATQRSFIVQAPAGSGKTELLIQRYLALLACVEVAPEEIIAITFTRKAATEMRQRILEALQAAQHPMPTQTHAQQTWQLACAALQRSQKSNWHLLENPQRLRVQTIDSLCANFTRRAPLLSGLGTNYQTLEKDAEQYYRQAIQRLLASLELADSVADSLIHLLLHLDNRLDLLENLLMRMLARRDQWLPHLITQDKQQYRTTLEQSLYHIVEDILQQCATAIPQIHQRELILLLQHATKHLRPDTDPLAIRIQALTTLPQPLPEHLDIWRAIANLLLTQAQDWRLKVDKNSGFPADDKPMKQRMLVLLEQLQPLLTLQQQLANVLNAPPVCYTDAQWQIIAALTELLPLLVAELTLLFRERGVADFSEIAMAATAALGEKDTPTDLTLLLDAQIRHLLVDEFQDTAITQFRLLEKLTYEWQPGDGRTLFLVGDPMQSIYRFREAEVGLFLKAQQEGLGNIPLESLVLQANFRSTPQIVQWINQHFTGLFPAQADISSGAVAFSPSTATRTSDISSGVFLHAFPVEQPLASVEKILEIITTAQSQQPQQCIAVLVRSRSHLNALIPALNQAQLTFSAIEIDSLAAQPVVQDLLALTGALLHLADRLCWLSILRAPWCGLRLNDLYVLARHNQHQPVWQTLRHYDAIPTLTLDAKQRLAIIVPILEHSIAQRQRLSLRDSVEAAWLALQGPACVATATELNSVQTYFRLLDDIDVGGKLPDYADLVEKISQQYISPATIDNRLQLMTIHKAKGLEFDTVIIPELQLKSQSDAEQLLLWLDRPRSAYNSDLILAPIKARSDDHDPIYRYLQRMEKIKSNYELTRLLYVAATRAKCNLHLLAHVQQNNQAIKLPDPQSFLHLLWPAFAPLTEKTLLGVTLNNQSESTLTAATPLLRRIRR